MVHLNNNLFQTIRQARRDRRLDSLHGGLTNNSFSGCRLYQRMSV